MQIYKSVWGINYNSYEFMPGVHIRKEKQGIGSRTFASRWTQSIRPVSEFRAGNDEPLFLFLVELAELVGDGDLMSAVRHIGQL